MCGILSVINFSDQLCGANLAKASAIIKHRGPDDEGFLTWQPGEEPEIWAGDDTAFSTREHWQYEDLPCDKSFKVGFGHRRLSILDLSPAGHQPMRYDKAGLAISFNGEVYNYLEIKEELEKLGHKFHSTTDTEVIMHAWEEWGPECINDFNGMFAFVLLDYNKNELYAVRDRFGVKPLYVYKGRQAVYITSEIKQVRTSPDYQFELDVPMALQFLAAGAADHTNNTFDTQIKYIPAGHYLHIDLTGNKGDYNIEKWYTLVPKPWHGTFDMAADQFRRLLTDAVKLRLRSDVKVGSCLSGGLDSSSIVCIAADLLKASGDHAGQETVTACYEQVKYDEWGFAQEVIKKTRARAHQVFPTFKDLQEEIDTFLWHQDEPVGSTSVFSQWSVFKKTHEAGLKVMIDGQGADEYLAGYGGNDLSFYTGLMRKGQILTLADEAKHYKKEKGAWPIGFLLGAMQLTFGKRFSAMLPARLRLKPPQLVDWLKTPQPAATAANYAQDLQENLLKQLKGEPLPAFLRYEDHNSMAWSVESRTPFMDYRLIEFTLGLPERFVYKRGVRKTILRKAMSGVIPAAIENRKDKMGFVTPEELWLKGEGKDWFLRGVDDAIKMLPALFNEVKLRQFCNDMISGKIPFDFTIWRVLSFGKWYALMTKNGG
jgi:asparagine synthase (glutamine-hydrolysing)